MWKWLLKHLRPWFRIRNVRGQTAYEGGIVITFSERKFGLKPDPIDARDFKFKAIQQPVPVPEKVDLRKQLSKVEDQGTIGSCSANATAGCLEYLQIKDGLKFFDVSRLFIYYTTRELEGTVEEDSGACLRDVIKAVAAKGYCSEATWPYKTERFAIKPSETAFKEAESNLISSYHSLEGITEMFNCLAEGYPFIFGLPLYASFNSDWTRVTGKVEMPNGNFIGNHAMCCVGYDIKKKVFIVRNSWGEQWGDFGFCYIPFSYMEMAMSPWVIHK